MNVGQGSLRGAARRPTGQRPTQGAVWLVLGLAALISVPVQADEKPCQVLLAKTPACASFETFSACEAVLKQAPECKTIEGLSSWLCMHEIGRVVQRYFACKERPDNAPACPDLIVKVDKYGNKLDTLIGCKL